MTSNKNKKVNFLHKIYIIIGIFLISVFMACYLVAIPTIKDIKQLNKDIINQKIDLEKKMNREKNKTHLIESIKKIEPEIDLLDNIYLDSNKELEFITTLEGIAAKHNVEQSIDLDFQKAKKSSIYKTIPLNITVDGKYFNVLEYLKNLESLTQYINVKELDISLREESSQSRKLNNSQNINQQFAKLTLTAETFWK